MQRDWATILASGEFFQKTLDCLRSHIAILDSDGTIIAVNATWNAFATANGLAAEFCGPGANYLRSCDNATGDCSSEAQVVANGIRSVLAGTQEYFYLEYPCHSPTEKRWFSIRVTRFEIQGEEHVVVAHDNITQRKLAELEICEANRRLGELVVTDGLTGIGNRRFFDRVLDQEWRRHGRFRIPLTVALVDVDCFKQFNDHEGHPAGDRCLREVAEKIDQIVGEEGDVARYGGEEFAVILPMTDANQAKSLLDDILVGIRQLEIPHATSRVGRGVVTVSIGSAVVVPHGQLSTADLLTRADHALYEAKSNGRDRCVISDIPLPGDTQAATARSRALVP